MSQKPRITCLRCYLGLCILLVSRYAFSQHSIKAFSDLPANADPRAVGQRLVERFLARPHSTFGAFKETPPKEITYPDACAWYGALVFTQKTGDKELHQRLVKRAELLLNEEASLVPYPRDVDRAVIGIIPLEVYNQTNDKRFRGPGLFPAVEQFKTLQPDEYGKLSPAARTWYSQGFSWHTRFWMDDMYMITVLQAQAYRATKNAAYLDRTARQMIAYLDTLQTPNGLFYHADDVPFYWGRGDGWLAAGMTELLSILPEDNIYRPRILQGYRNMMKTLLNYQDKNGMWHQLLDDPTAWPETSGSAMFTFAFIRGLKKGWLDEKTYGPAARKAWIALCGYLDDKGDLSAICEGTNKKNDRQYYLDRKRITGDLHGQAPMIWCAMSLVQD
ncbi:MULTISPECIES: glycoside hydrolase family 88 protein [unclassified Spirosoma]|uniref:glycoside hydrolase family 88/105 protein n=1 Tax=unclassified Spirosoma TaxID=2621999 RepID=UPI00095A739F|nr:MULTISPECIES: glycoside hydrolase family 88 protein [unclassified Spirosoma]MBN8822546.1 glycoside hydrolase family 88 protein [Spirosoma sp.]OJW74044.1 MAG: glycosyl hydrolase [Spirosoma sp. 48-14]